MRALNHIAFLCLVSACAVDPSRPSPSGTPEGGSSLAQSTAPQRPAPPPASIAALKVLPAVERGPDASLLNDDAMANARAMARGSVADLGLTPADNPAEADLHRARAAQ